MVGAGLAGFGKGQPVQLSKAYDSTIPTKSIQPRPKLLICFMVCRKQKSPVRGFFYDPLAEAVRFELTDPFEPPVFKTGAIDHSATLPAGGIVTSF